MTHADITAQELLEDLPPDVQTALKSVATRRRVPMTELLKEGLLKIADEINAAASKRRPSKRPLVAA